MKRTTVWIAVTLLALALGLNTATAKNEFSKTEGLKCTVCHDKPGSKLLTDKGKYFELKRSIDGYDRLTETFGKCTTCHVAKPGSKKLTRTGRRFDRLVSDMDGLQRWLEDQHPAASTPTPEENDSGE